MKEKIYTIPVTDAFNEDCECPMCQLEKKLEEEAVDYYLGAALMEPDHRIETNRQGFCRRHFELLYNKQENRLGLGLIIDTHMQEQNAKLNKEFQQNIAALRKESETPLLKSISNKISNKKTETAKYINELVKSLSELEACCAICNKLDYTLDRYIDVILYLWFKESDFRNTFNNKKGFCLRHFKMLLQGTQKYLNDKESATFVDNLVRMQLKNLKRVQEEVNWFTQKFDYRNSEAAWGNSKDAIPRSIQKLSGFCRFK